jgi:hypothetical protein
MADIAPQAAKAFVDGWLHSGPEAQVITALFLGNKLRKSDFGKALFSKAGGGSGAGSLLGTRGATMANPVFVSVVGGGEGKTPLTKVKEIAKVAGPTALALGAEFAPAIAPAAGIGWLAATQGNHNYRTRGTGASSPSNPAGSIPAPGYGNTSITLINQLNGREISRATAVTDQIEQGRLGAGRQASG